MSNDKDFINSIDDLREVLSVVSEEVPGLLRGLRDLIYSKDAAKNMAESVATFYTTLVDAGIPKDEALKMARGYMINLRELVSTKNINIGDFKKTEDGEDD
jgi:hypothetical protein